MWVNLTINILILKKNCNSMKCYRILIGHSDVTFLLQIRESIKELHRWCVALDLDQLLFLNIMYYICLSLTSRGSFGGHAIGEVRSSLFLSWQWRATCYVYSLYSPFRLSICFNRLSILPTSSPTYLTSYQKSASILRGERASSSNLQYQMWQKIMTQKWGASSKQI